MRFKKGSSVEVSRTGIEPWWPATILSGNGHTYIVQYMDDRRERVPRKALRPPPPPLAVETTEDCAPGDLVEVLDGGCWKLAELLGLTFHDDFLVKFIGHSVFCGVNQSHLRLQQSWKGGQWTVTQENLKSSKPVMNRPPDLGSSTNKVVRPDFYVQGKRPLVEVEEPGTVFMGIRKKRCIEREGICQKYVGFPQSANEVHDIVPPYKTPSEQCAYDRTAILNHFERREHADDDCRSVASSTGSCSPHRCPLLSIDCAYRSPAIGSGSDIYQTDNSVPVEVSVQTTLLNHEIHRLELEAYSSSLSSLYVSGPLSWDREALITNLRLALHISDEEHSSLIKQIISFDRQCRL